MCVVAGEFSLQNMKDSGFDFDPGSEQHCVLLL